MTEDLIRQRFSEAHDNGLNFAACRIAGSEDIYFFLSYEAPKLKRVETTTFSKPTFVYSPYGAGNRAYVFHAHKIYRNNTLIHNEPDLTTKEPLTANWPVFKNNVLLKQEYTGYVEKAIQAMQADKLDKIVAARCKTIEQAPDPATFFIKLIREYRSATVYHFHAPSAGCWFGASPEKLISLHNNTLSTVALAGTLPVNEQQWSGKEFDEHDMVSDFIEQVFTKHKLNFKKSKTETVEAGNLKHLSCNFDAILSDEEVETRFHKILSDLNPTPAVCGIPQFDASVFIGNHEKMERRFYSGFIGLVTEPKHIELYVNLRCMQTQKKESILYAGAGITPLSNPEREWDETERKMQVLETLL